MDSEKVTGSSVIINQHDQGGALGVDVSSYQPPQEAPATLHLHQVPEAMRSVGHEPKSSPTPEMVYEPEAQTFVAQPVIPAAGPDSQTHSAEKDPLAPKQHEEASGSSTMLNQVVNKASEIMGEVKGLAGEAFGEIKEKASEAWNAVAGVVGAAPGKELREDRSERIVAGADVPISQHGSELGVNISSFQPPADAPAGIYPHGEIKTAATKDEKRATEVVGENLNNLPGR